jgi:hypothetical protein
LIQHAAEIRPQVDVGVHLLIMGRRGRMCHRGRNPMSCIRGHWGWSPVGRISGIAVGGDL